ncbi:MAG: DUF4265 domain-containing protein [Polyangiaceae bacterium]|nr:DUF4265 domain-containing protein [Polyangiaceae bacterium]
MHRKIVFHLEQDDEGFPPAATESLWARSTERNNEFVIENLPFFAREATLGDVVDVTEKDGSLYYRSTICRSGNSLIRIICYNGSEPLTLCKELEAMGCVTEYIEAYRMVAVNVSSGAKLDNVRAYLERTCCRRGARARAIRGYWAAIARCRGSAAPRDARSEARACHWADRRRYIHDARRHNRRGHRRGGDLDGGRRRGGRADHGGVRAAGRGRRRECRGRDPGAFAIDDVERIRGR